MAAGLYSQAGDPALDWWRLGWRLKWYKSRVGRRGGWFRQGCKPSSCERFVLFDYDRKLCCRGGGSGAGSLVAQAHPNADYETDVQKEDGSRPGGISDMGGFGRTKRTIVPTTKAGTIVARGICETPDIAGELYQGPGFREPRCAGNSRSPHRSRRASRREVIRTYVRDGIVFGFDLDPGRHYRQHIAPPDAGEASEKCR